MKKFNNSSGFTMPELLMSVLILTAVFVGAILVFVRSMQLSELAENSSTAVWAAKKQMTQIESTDYSMIATTYNNATFTAAGLNGMGVTYVDSSNPDLLEVTVSFSWQQKSGRIIGEDADLDGALDAGEDANGNGMLDSPVGFTTLVYDS